MAEYNLTLLKNSHSFLEEALLKAVKAEENPQEWKFAILFLVQSIELSLKEKLRREHPIFIYRNIDKENDYTISLEHAIRRLKRICKIEISEKDIKLISIASEWRNSIVHSEFKFNTRAVKSTFAKLFGFQEYFHRKHLDENLQNIIRGSSWLEAIKIKDYAYELLNQAKYRFKDENINNDLIWDCPLCNQHSFVIQDEINKCYVCGYDDEVIVCDSCAGSFFVEDIIALPQYGETEQRLCKSCHNAYLDELEYENYHGEYCDEIPEGYEGDYE